MQTVFYHLSLRQLKGWGFALAAAGGIILKFSGLFQEGGGGVFFFFLVVRFVRYSIRVMDVVLAALPNNANVTHISRLRK